MTGWTTFGHPGPVRLLSRVVAANRLAHGYLITGPSQVGRRTLALDLARAVNCQPMANLFGDTPDRPCGACTQCDRISRSLHTDVRVIDRDTPTEKARGGEDEDAAQHKQISIEHIRDLLREASLKPFEGACRVFIIDGAEIMNPASANALLKTLEEPADGVLIILIAPSAAVLPITITSRCQLIDLRPVAASVIESALLDRFKATAEDAYLLSRLCRGRPGWAISALSDPTALDRHTQAGQRIIGVLTGGLEERFRYARELSGGFRRDRDPVMAEMDLWLDWLRDVAFAHHRIEDSISNVDWLPTLRALGEALSEDDIAAGVDAVLRTRDALDANAQPQLALEVMMLDLPQVDRAAVPGRAVLATGDS